MGHQRILIAISYVSLGLLTAIGGLAQEPQQQDQQPHAWRRAGEVPPEQPQQPAQSEIAQNQIQQDQIQQSQIQHEQIQQQDQIAQDQGPANQGPPPPPNFSANQGFGQAPASRPQSARQPMQPMPPNDSYNVPPVLTIRPGTFVSVRINQWLSSDRNQQGDAFFATLAEPIIVDGVVVAQRGQTVSGRVTEAQKAGRVEGTSRLGIELTGLTLVDGQQLQIQSQMINRNGTTSVGRDVGAVAGTTALGAAIGAGADWGRGAAIGAGAGAAAGLIGVLLTRGHPTVIYPESVLTFRLTTPATVATERAPQAFRYVDTRDYGNSGYSQRAAPRLASAPPPPPPYYSGPSYYPYYPYYGGGFSVFVGPRYYGGYGYYRGYRGFRR